METPFYHVTPHYTAQWLKAKPNNGGAGQFRERLL